MEEASPDAPYRIIEHTADLGIHVFGSTESALYENAARALFDLLVERSETREAHTTIIRVEGQDRADLMVNWLRELLFLWAGKGLLIQGVAVSTLSERNLEATVQVIPYDPDCHAIRTDIKAVTYHRIQVNPLPAGWEAEIIFDV